VRTKLERNMKSNMPEVEDRHLITIKAIRQKHVEQLYGTRGDFNDQPDGPTENEYVIGCLMNGGGIIYRDRTNLHLRMVWPHRYLVSIGLGRPGMDGTPEAMARKAALDKLEQIFID